MIMVSSALSSEPRVMLCKFISEFGGFHKRRLTIAVEGAHLGAVALILDASGECMACPTIGI
jgi:hypothetical protein